jgi:ATP-binding cassette, subfamily B, bacterial
MRRPDPRYRDVVIYRRLLSSARRYWPHIGATFFVSLLSTPLTLLTPVPLKIAVDSVIGDEPLPGFLAWLPDSLASSDETVLLVAAVMLVVVAGLKELQAITDSLLRMYTGEKLVLGFRARLFRHVQRLSLAYHDTRGTADSLYRIHSDATSIQTIAVDGVIPFVTAIVTLVAMIVVVALIDAMLAAIALVVAPILFVLTWSYRRRLRQRHREVKRLESSALAVVQEVLSSLRVVKAFGQEEREEERFVSRSSEGVRARIRVSLVDGSFGLLTGLATAAGSAIVLFVGVRQVQSGAITLGDLLLVVAYLSSLYAPLSTITKRVTKLQSAFASAERALALLDEPREVTERAHARRLTQATGHVAFDGVCFSFDGARPVLRDICFEVESGMRVGIAGRTGAGKTTLVSLMTRFYDPSAGAIFLDGVDLRDYKLRDLRSQFAIVLQEPVLFSTSIRENIGYARPEASFEEIVAAAEAAHANDFVEELPAGYDTRVGERGMTLSGGERQRISLARAFLKDAPILILDEPTSSVDLGTEAVIMEAMNRLMQGRTAFLIAHRSSTLEDCDRVLHIDRGRLTRIATGATTHGAGATSVPDVTAVAADGGT